MKISQDKKDTGFTRNFKRKRYGCAAMDEVAHSDTLKIVDANREVEIRNENGTDGALTEMGCEGVPTGKIMTFTSKVNRGFCWNSIKRWKILIFA